MTWIILLAVGTGIGLGFFISEGMIANLDQISTIALSLLLLGIGIDLGGNKKIWSSLKLIGWRIILIPLAIAVGSIAGAGLGTLVLNLSLNESTAVGAGFGWYSLSGIIIARLYSDEIGALAFLANVFREIMAVLFIPLLAKYAGYLSTIAAGGATSMDTVLPLISRSTDHETTLIAFVAGAILSALVPVLVPLLLRL